MNQEEAFSPFKRWFEPMIREQIGFHLVGVTGGAMAMAMAEKAGVWRAKPKVNKNGQKQQKAGETGRTNRDNKILN